MDPSVLLQPLLSLWCFMPLVLLLAILRSPWFKGHLGEFVVNASARLFVDKTRYHLIKNVTLSTEEGDIQSDHIIVSGHGWNVSKELVAIHSAFLVEDRKMRGWIFGDENHLARTQKIFKHSQEFQNPLNHNYKHVRTLQSLFGLGDGRSVRSWFALGWGATFKIPMPENVIYGGKHIQLVKAKLEE